MKIIRNKYLGNLGPTSIFKIPSLKDLEFGISLPIAYESSLINSPRILDKGIKPCFGMILLYPPINSIIHNDSLKLELENSVGKYVRDYITFSNPNPALGWSWKHLTVSSSNQIECSLLFSILQNRKLSFNS